MARPQKRACLDDGERITLSKWQRRGLSLSAGTTATIRLPKVGAVELVSIPKPFGSDWFMICPASGHRCRVLYRPPGERIFACQKHWRGKAGYATQFYTRYHRACRKLSRLERRLSPVNAQGIDDGNFYKPRNMHCRTFARIWEQMDACDDIMNQHIAGVMARFVG